MDDGVANALLAGAHGGWTKPGSILGRTSWATDDAVALIAGEPDMENTRELNVCMPSGFPEDVILPPQSVADVERS